ncbi:MAG: sigma-70 family RNA polymerase sigma factor [Planctomycetota bacterium]
MTQRFDADDVLLDRFAAGDADAFGELVKRHVDVVYAAARRRDVVDAADLTQATFVLLLQRPAEARRSAQRHGGVVVWLLATLRNLARNAARRQRRRGHHESAAAYAVGATADADPSAVLAWREVAGVIDDEVLALPATSRDAIVGRFYNGLATAELASCLRCSEEAARQRVSRGLSRLRHRLERRNIGLPATGLASLLTAKLVAAAPREIATTITMTSSMPAALLVATSSGAMLKLGMTATAAAIVLGGAAFVLIHEPASAQPVTKPAANPPPATQPSAVALAKAVDDNPLPADGVIHERVLRDYDEWLDLDTGRIYRRDEKIDEATSVVAGFSADVLLSTAGLSPGLQGQMLTQPVVNEAFDLPVAASDVAYLWRLSQPKDFAILDAMGTLPRTFLFRTRNGAGGVLQIVELIERDSGEDVSAMVGDPGIRLQFRILTRGEGDRVGPKVERYLKTEGGWGGPDREEHAQLLSAMRMTMQAVVRYHMEHGTAPADLEVLRAASNNELRSLPDTLVYVQPVYNLASPRSRQVVLFETVSPEPGDVVMVAYEDGVVGFVNEDELRPLLKRAGLTP